MGQVQCPGGTLGWEAWPVVHTEQVAGGGGAPPVEMRWVLGMALRGMSHWASEVGDSASSSRDTGGKQPSHSLRALCLFCLCAATRGAFLSQDGFEIQWEPS